MNVHLQTTPPKEYPYDVDPAQPVFVQGVRLQANESKQIEIPPSRVIFISRFLAFGTAIGDVSLAFGERGDFFDIAPGDEIHLSRVSVLQVRNNTGVVREFQMLISNDPAFSYRSSTRGL